MKRSKKVMMGLALLTLGVVMIFSHLFITSGRADNPAVALAPVAVEVTKVSTATVTERVSAVGTISAARDVEVSSETGGRITGAHAHVGDYVRAGQTLIQVDDELKTIAVDQARAQRLAAETNFRKAEKDYRRAEQLRENGDISDAEFETYRLAYRSAEAQYTSADVALRFAERQLEDTRIKAPVSGYVVSRDVELGEMVNPGKVVANIVDLSSIKVKLSIPEEEIAKIRLRQPATLRVDAFPTDMYTGVVHSISAKTETPSGHTYAVEVLVKPENPTRLKVGMFGRVEITVHEAKDAVAISKESLISDGTREAMLFVADGNTAKLRTVMPGVRSGALVQIVEGLTEGELVISFGQKGLKDGTPVRYEVN